MQTGLRRLSVLVGRIQLDWSGRADYYGNAASTVNISICTIRGNVFTWCDGITHTWV